MNRIILVGCIILSLVTTLLSPRFGRSFGNEIAGNYHYSGTEKEAGVSTELYEDEDGNLLAVSYENRFERKIQVSYHDHPPFTMEYRLDMGVTQHSGADRDLGTEWQYLSFDFLSNDSSGTFYFHYLLPLFVIGVVYSLGRKLLVRGGQLGRPPVQWISAIVLLALSVFISLRLF